MKPGEGALESNRDTAFGTKVTFSCPVGQEFATGKSKITTECLISGNWSVSYIPKCQGKKKIVCVQFVRLFTLNIVIQRCTAVLYHKLITDFLLVQQM